MSTGEARRILIARALVTEPRALVFDEPTTGLDIVARGRFLAFTRRIAQQGTTIVLITHHVEEIVPEIDRVVLLQRGRIAADGVKSAILTPGAPERALRGACYARPGGRLLLRAGFRRGLGGALR